jgi:hypothetical protein
MVELSHLKATWRYCPVFGEVVDRCLSGVLLALTRFM